MPIDVEAETEALFARPPEEFTAARNDLARRLRGERRPAEAGKVATLRRPTLPAWAVNQLVRRHPDRVDELIAAGRQLAQAQRRLLSGVRDDSLREATARRRELLAELTGAAVGILAEAGAATATHRPAIAATLEAASADDGAAERVRAGRLSADLPAPSGFGGVAGLTVVPDTAPADEATPGDDDARRAAEAALEAATAQVEGSRRQAASAAEERAEARRAAITAAEEAERLEQRAEQARRKASEANEHADEADRRAGEAERAVGAAERALAEARAGLGELSR
jgi:hypothetical protein